MMIRKIVKIDESKCNGCGLCVTACHEGAIGLVNGKAKLLRDDYCDGLGDCLPACPTGAISFEEREALAYDEDAVMENKGKLPMVCGCLGSEEKVIPRAENFVKSENVDSELRQWPVQIKLVAPNAGYFKNADLLIAADCSAYAYGNFHQDFIKDRITIIGCPKLDSVDYSEKLSEILKLNDIKSILVTRMEVPCCGGLENAVKTAIEKSGKDISCVIVTISNSGKIV